MNLSTVLLSLAGSIVAAVVSAWITARLSLRKFYSEKQWERKSAVYSNIIESIHHIREHADTNLAFEGKELEIPPDGKKLLDGNLQRAMADLRRHRDVGSFVISAESVGVINWLFSELDKSAEIGRDRTFFEYCDYRVGAVDQALGKMRDAAQRDLAKT